MKVLTAQQQAFFDAFGFVALPGFLKDRIEGITAEFERVFADYGGGHDGKPHDFKQRSVIIPFLDRSAAFCDLLDDPQIEGIATDLLGEGFNYISSDGNCYATDTGWHSDGFHDKHRFMKIVLYLDPLTKDTGALRVIPGSHRPGDSFAELVKANLTRDKGFWGFQGRDVPCVALETKPGDLLVFNHNLRHASYGGSTRRRMFTINLCQRMTDEEGIADLKQYIAGHKRFFMESMFLERMVKTAGPRRRTHLEQVLANEGHLPELSRQERLVRTETARG